MTPIVYTYGMNENENKSDYIRLNGRPTNQSTNLPTNQNNQIQMLQNVHKTKHTLKYIQKYMSQIDKNICMYIRHETPVLDHPIKIIHIDNDLVVLDKPSSVPVSS